jgi:hypothetical protein
MQSSSTQIPSDKIALHNTDAKRKRETPTAETDPLAQTDQKRPRQAADNEQRENQEASLDLPADGSSVATAMPITPDESKYKKLTEADHEGELRLGSAEAVAEE